MPKNYFSNILIFLISILWLVPIVTTLLVAFKTREEYLNQQFSELPICRCILYDSKESIKFSKNAIVLGNS